MATVLCDPGSEIPMGPLIRAPSQAGKHFGAVRSWSGILTG